MSAYSTLTIDREKAEEMVRAVRAKKRDDPVKSLSNEALMEELHEYVYSEKHTEIVGLLYNYDLLQAGSKEG